MMVAGSLLVCDTCGTNRSPKKFPVTEIFGPTVQGEGTLQGAPAYFVRFGGCDFKCGWCDTPHAVLPQAVRANERLTSNEICMKLALMPRGPKWIVITGGNPALHELEPLVHDLHKDGYKVSVETQGTKWKEWIRWCDSVCVSPKPPSAGMGDTLESLSEFMQQACPSRNPCLFLKVVVFDNRDYEYAQWVHAQWPGVPMFVSAGNDAGRTVDNPGRVDERTHEQVVLDLLVRSRWLTNRLMVDEAMASVRVQSQYHVLLWGNKVGH